MKILWNTRAEMVASFGTNLVCAEIGVERGHFSAEIIKNNPKELVLIDPWFKQTGDYAKDPSNYLNNLMYLVKIIE
jgi:hypothetical protein